MASHSRRSQPWYKDGLRFECQRCGSCCSGAPGYVQMTSSEALAMAQELGLELEEFRQRYTRTEYAPSWYLKEVPSENGLDCIMLERESEPPHLSKCKVHRCRPQQCRTWPFWPDNLRGPGSWSAQAKRCPGFNKGSLFSVRTIEATCVASGLDID